jgi:hypothetical protein
MHSFDEKPPFRIANPVDLGQGFKAVTAAHTSLWSGRPRARDSTHRSDASASRLRAAPHWGWVTWDIRVSAVAQSDMIADSFGNRNLLF